MIHQVSDRNPRITQIVRPDIDKKSHRFQIQNTYVQMFQEFIRNKTANPPVIDQKIRVLLFYKLLDRKHLHKRRSRAYDLPRLRLFVLLLKSFYFFFLGHIKKPLSVTIINLSSPKSQLPFSDSATP